MAKIGPKELERRALRERKAGKPAKSSPSKRSKPKPAARVAGKAKARVASNKWPPRQNTVIAGPTTPQPAPHTRPLLPGDLPTFDRVTYQKVYTKLWHKNHRSPLKDWPEEDRLLLSALKSRPT